MNHEIERKYLAKHLPEALESYENDKLLQGYLALDPNGTEVRLRKIKDDYLLTVKNDEGLVRQEEEIAITSQEFERLWPFTEGRRLMKTRCYIPLQKSILIQLDIYEGELEGLIIAEVEFDSAKESKAFTAPAWFGQEVTDIARYRNKNLIMQGKGKTLDPRLD